MLVHAVSASLVLVSCIVFHCIGAQSDEVTTASSSSNTTPSTPRHVEVANVTSSSITLRWQPPEFKNGPLEGYNVFFMPKNDHHPGNSFTTKATSATVASLIYNTEYIVHVKAYNKVNGTEHGSEAVGVTASTVIEAPTKVRKLHLVSRGDASAVVGWNPPLESNGPLDGYRVFWCLGVNTTPEGHQPRECKTQWLKGHVTRAKEVELLSSANYSVYVSPYNSVKNGTNGTFMLVGEEMKIYVETLREAPQAVENIKVHVVSQTSATILWEAVPEADGYIVEWCQDGNCTEQATNETEITIKDLRMGTSYNVSVVGFRTDPEGEKQTGPFRIAQVLFQESHGHAGQPRHSKYVAGTIVCSFLAVLLAIAIVYVWRRPWAKPGPTPYQRMSSLEQDDDDILFMKTEPTKSL
ncbi:netrin receptor DCC-like isoform X2 [Ornithodoros turicata]|uniref:netrin receptor DCC-like isoform X2 n=1 Tax=Ornithodoros turicata TaxID=34597 RepID=UPI003139F31E